MQQAVHTQPPTLRARPGDFRGFYREHYGFVTRAVGRFGVAPAEQHDAVQDTFVTAYRRLSTRHGDSERAWLYGIARRIASNYRRGARRAERTVAAAAHDGPPTIAPSTAEAIHTLDRFLATLNDNDREVFVAAEVLGMSAPEIGAALGMRQTHVYSRIRLLRLQLASHTPEDLFAALSRLRNEAPRPSERQWSMLAPLLVVESKRLSLIATLSVMIPLAIAGVLVAGTGASMGSHAPAVAAAPELPPTAARAMPSTPASYAPQAPTPATSSTPIVRPVRRTASVATSPRERDDALARDNALLASVVSAASRGDHGHALRLLDEHARTFPDSPQSDMRAALRIDALCELGRVAQARGEIAVFRHTHANSPALPRVEDACR